MREWAAGFGLALCLAACGGGGGGEDGGAEPPPDSALRLSAATSPFANCGPATGGTLYRGAEVEPHLAVDPSSPQNLLAAWQQDRWSSGGAQGLVSAYSRDGGRSWTAATPPFSRCAGGEEARATDPWVSFGPDGTAHQAALAFTGDTFGAGSSNLMLASRSADGGASWSTPAVLIRDSAEFFNDKQAITADPTDAGYVYTVWDRLARDGSGASYLARSTDGGLGWEAARAIYDPGVQHQTLGNQIVVLPDGTLVDFFTEIDGSGTALSSMLGLVRSTDRGQSWSARIKIADLVAVGAQDPETSQAIRDGALLGSIAVGPGGQLAVSWQDARASGGARDAIAFSRSLDGGLSWSTAVAINAAQQVQAFTPTVAIDARGGYAVLYFDLRNNTADRASLPADLWLARSDDGVGWSEVRVSGSFDLQRAPDAGGLFLGDYHGLRAQGSGLAALYVRTGGSDDGNRTDVYFARLEPASPAKRSPATRALPLAAPGAEAQARSQQRLRKLIDSRRPPAR